MRAIVTVLGKDRVGITANVCALLAKYDINILDISQTILQEYFTMVMLVDTSACTVSIGEMRDILEHGGKLYTQLKIDDINNLGAVRIRIRSLMAAMDARKAKEGQSATPSREGGGAA